jgi:hypothetical protein
MSSKATTQPDSRLIREYDNPPLEKGQRAQLHMLGWKDADIVEMTVPQALAKLEARSAKPGSKAFLKTQKNPLTGTADVSNLVGKYSNEEIEKRNATRPESSGVQVTTDEFTNKCLQAGSEAFAMNDYTGRVIKGADPLNAVLIEMQERFPGRRFRWMHPNEPPVMGPAWDPVYDSQSGKRILNGELALSWMPQEVYVEGREKPNLARSRAMTGSVEKNQDDLLRSTEAEGNVVEGKFEMGKSEAFHA